jgi:hypothetical protein
MLPVYDMSSVYDCTIPKRSVKKVNNLKYFLKSCLEFMKEKTTLKTLREMIDHYTQDREIPTTQRVVNQVLCNKRTNKELRLSVQIGEYDMDNVILDLGLDVNVLPRKTWEMMGKQNLVWSIVQLRLVSQLR